MPRKRAPTSAGAAIADIFGTSPSKVSPKIGSATKKLKGAVEPAYPLTTKTFTKKKTPKGRSKHPKF